MDHCPSYKAVLLVAACSACLVAGSKKVTAAATCPPQIASMSLTFKSDAHGTNIGVVPTGFVAPSDGSPVVHGIDVSKYQTDPIFAGVRECGGDFAYIRLSAGREPSNELSYRAFWANAKAAGLLTGPYHHLTVTDATSSLHQLEQGELDVLREHNVTQAVAEAKLFKTRLTELLGYDPLADQAPGTYGGPYLPAMLDVTETPQASMSQTDRNLFSPIYGAAICAWIKEFQSDERFKNQPVVLFTKPFVFREYQLVRAPCDLNQLKVWVFYHSRTGDRPLTEKDPNYREAIEELCLQGGKNRCVFEQYTSYGGFAVYLTGAGLDLDRFIGTLEGLRAMLQRASAITAKRRDE
jgi:hypothetical protein